MTVEYLRFSLGNFYLWTVETDYRGSFNNNPGLKAQVKMKPVKTHS